MPAGPDAAPELRPGLIDLTADATVLDVGAHVEDLAPPYLPRFTLSDPIETAATLRVSAVLAAYRGAALTVLLLAFTVGVGREPLHLSVQTALSWSVVLGAIAVLTVTGGQVHATLLRARNHTVDELRVADTEQLSIDLNSQSRANELQILKYQELAVSQARISFRHGQTAMAVALGILLGGSSSVLFLADGRGQVVVGVLTALGSGFSAFLAATFLDARNRSIEQLNRSHVLPLAKNLLLFAHKLTEGVQTARTRDDLLKDIVTSTLEAVEMTLDSSPATPRPGPPWITRRARSGDGTGTGDAHGGRPSP